MAHGGSDGCPKTAGTDGLGKQANSEAVVTTTVVDHIFRIPFLKILHVGR